MDNQKYNELKQWPVRQPLRLQTSLTELDLIDLYLLYLNFAQQQVQQLPGALNIRCATICIISQFLSQQYLNYKELLLL